jgi:ArsR family transcriptional regulator
MLEKEMRTIKLFKALSNPSRYRIIKLLYEKPMTAGELKKEIKKTKSATSQHLRLLKNLDILKYYMKGNEVIYELKKSKIPSFINEIEKYYLRIQNKSRQQI